MSGRKQPIARPDGLVKPPPPPAPPPPFLQGHNPGAQIAQMLKDGSVVCSLCRASSFDVFGFAAHFSRAHGTSGHA